VFLVYGHGGIGKSTLLRRFGVLAGEVSPITVARVDWELEQHRNSVGFPAVTGPPIWRVLDRLYRALVDGANSRRDRRHIERAFSPFRRQMVRVPELMDRARALGIDATVGHRPIDEDGRRHLMDAASTGLNLTLGAAGAPVAAGGQVAATATMRWLADRVGRLEPDAYAGLTADVDALVRAFGEGLQAVDRKCGPTALLLDTCDLLGDALAWFPELVSRGGARTVWVLAMREDTDEDPSATGSVGRLVAELPADTVVVLPLQPFTPNELVDYLRHDFQGGLPAGVTVERMIRRTGGVPLAVSLVASALQRGTPAEDVFDDSAPDSVGRQVVIALMRRYLARLHASPAAAADLALIHGLALLIDTVDAEILAALWDVPVSDVPGTLERLRHSYEFVLGGSRPLHQDVATAVLGCLRGPVERASVHAMNERAAAVLRARLPTRPSVVESRVSDEDWQRDMLSLLWHTFWADMRAGHRLLCHVFAPVAVLEAGFAVELTSVGCFFESAYASADRAVLYELSLLASRPYRTDSVMMTLPSALSAVTERTDESIFAETDQRRFVDTLSVMHGDLFGMTPVDQLNLAEDLVCRADRDGPVAQRNNVELHRRLTVWIVFQQMAVDSPVDLELALHAARRGVAVSPEFARAHAVLCLLLLYAGNPVDAEAVAREALRLESGNPNRAGMLGTALRMQRRYEEAIPLLRKAVAGLAVEDSWLARSDLGGTLLAEGMSTENPALVAEAIAMLRTVVRIWPSDLTALRMLADALIVTKELGSAEITINQALTLDRQPDLLKRLGTVLMALGRLREAHDVYREAIDIDPDDAEAHSGLAVTLGELGDAVGAEREGREAIRLGPDEPLAYENLAVSLHKQGRQDAAAELQRQAAEIAAHRTSSGVEVVFRLAHPSDESASSMRQTTAVERIGHLMAVGANDAAIDELTALLDQSPDSGPLRTVLGCLLNEQRRFDEAETALRAAIAADPANAGAYAALALSLHMLGHHASVVEMARTAARLGPDDAEVLATIAPLFGESGQRDEAIEYGRKAAQLWPDSVDVKANLALALRIVGQFAEAERLLSDAVELNPRDADAHADLGEVQLFLGRHDDATGSLRQAVGLGDARQTVRVHTLLGLLLRAAEPDLARAHFEQALSAVRIPGSAFAHIEMRAVASAALGRPETVAMLTSARALRTCTDIFRKPVYDLLGQATASGLLDVWRDIVADDPTAAGPFTLPIHKRR
jgi:Flp pilus assembly protein TadD